MPIAPARAYVMQAREDQDAPDVIAGISSLYDIEMYPLINPVSHSDSRSDPIGESKPSSGCETVYWDSLPDFFFKDELVPVGMANIL